MLCCLVKAAIFLIVCTLGGMVHAVDFEYAPEFEFRSSFQFAPHAVNGLLNLPAFALFYHVHRGENLYALFNYSKLADIKRAERFADSLNEEMCSGFACRHERLSQKVNLSLQPSRFTYPDGWNFTVSADLFCTEITTARLSLEAAKSNVRRLQNDVFDRANAFGLKPANQGDALSGLHVNVNANRESGFDGVLLLNFLIDLANNPELATGVWGRSLYSAMPVAMIPKARAALQTLRDEAVCKLAHQEKVEVSWVADQYYRYVQKSVRGKGDAVNVYSIIDPQAPAEEARVELRFFRMVKNAEQYTTVLEVIDRRLHYLEDFKTIIPFLDAPVLTSRKQIAEKYKTYLSDMGMASEKYLALAPARFREKTGFCARFF